MSLIQHEILRSRDQVLHKGHKLNAYGSKYMLDCIEQEWRVLYRWQTIYTMRHVSICRTRENNVSKQEHVTDTRESVRRQGCLQIRNKIVSRNESRRYNTIQ